MNKTIKKVIASILVVATLVGIFFLGYFIRDLTTDSELREAYNFLQTYKNYYLYDDEGNLVKDIANAILDDYSEYYTKEEYQKVKLEAYGNMMGIGLTFRGNSLKIYGVLGNSPCKIAGIKAGGVITQINVGSGYKELSSYNDFANEFDLVKDNGYLSLKIDYNGEVLEYSVQKREYKRTFVDYYDSQGSYTFSDASGQMQLIKTSEETPVVSDKIGYIKYEKFYGRDSGITGSAGQILEVMNKFKQDGKSQVIIDLRGNGGGYVEVFKNMVVNFIDGDKSGKNLVSYAVDKNGAIEYTYANGSKYSEYGFENIIILADENTASASESFIGAVLDYDKTNKVTLLVASSTLNGETVYKTYGKGIMQSTYKHIDGSAVKLTVAQIYWPLSNTCIHKVGVIGEKTGKILAVDKDKMLEKAFEICS